VAEICIGQHPLQVEKYVKAKPKKKEQAFQALLREINKNELCERMDMSQVFNCYDSEYKELQGNKKHQALAKILKQCC
jgi:hypothetical protein